MTPEALRPLFRERLGCTVVSVQQAPVGNGQETWFVQTAEGPEYVLRRSAAGGTLEWTDRRAEFDAMAGLAGSGLPVPATHWFEPEGGALGRAAFAMDRLPGKPLHTGSAEVNPAIAAQLGRWLARLHALDPGEDPPTSAAATEKELAAVAARYRAEQPLRAMDGLLEWLRANRPADDPPAARLWGDPGPHNLLVDGAEITALLDWELAKIGHPLEDLGIAVWSCLGILDARLLVDAYETERGAPVDREVLRWFEVLASVSRVVMILAGARAYAEGRAPSPNLAGLGMALVTSSLLRAARSAWGIEPPVYPESPAAAGDGDRDERIRAALAASAPADDLPPPASDDPEALVEHLARRRAAMGPLNRLYGPVVDVPAW